jgi:hypothetical protein
MCPSMTAQIIRGRHVAAGVLRECLWNHQSRQVVGHKISRRKEKVNDSTMASGVPKMKRKKSFVEDNMPGSYDLLCGNIKAAIAFVRRGVAHKDASN